jgi:hypothetical protein
MKITGEVLEALRHAVREAGYPARFAREAGIENVYLHRYLSGGTKSIKLEIWLRLYPHLRGYLPPDFPEPEGFRPAGLSPEEQVLLDCFRALPVVDRLEVVRDALDRRASIERGAPHGESGRGA